MKHVQDEAFRPYGRVLDIPVQEFVNAIGSVNVVKDGTMYELSVPEFEKLPVFTQLQHEVYGGLPIEFGHCSGHNTKLNAVEYHRSSEVDIAATDLILMLGRQQDIDYRTNQYDTSKMELFFVPAGTAVELYGTTLHFAPCSVDGKEFRCGVVLPKGTNEALPVVPDKDGENALLFALNKWLIAHKESGLDADGAWIGLVGDNLEV